MMEQRRWDQEKGKEGGLLWDDEHYTEREDEAQTDFHLEWHLQVLYCEEWIDCQDEVAECRGRYMQLPLA
jgi:hypothetical protein